ncbi:MAG: dihydrofolate reductase [Candidatus Omnitrophota bacterium]|nr:dihydrofolate reductase [Candidatus Omnitrophota bacterium]
MISLIVAASRNGVIGANNKLPWHLPADLKRFKQLTMGYPILMGRKTFESIGKPLPGRTNIVITRQKGFQCCGTTVVHSVEEALLICENEKETFVIGGAEIFQQALPLADRIYLTRIEKDFEGDTKLFEIDPAGWKEVSREEFLNDPLPHTFITYERS